MNRILIFFDYFFPAYKAGGPIQSGLNIYRLAEKYKADFSVITRNRDIDGTKLETEKKMSRIWYGRFSVFFIVRQIFKSKVIIANSLFSTKYSIIPVLLSTLVRKKIFIFPRGELASAALSLGRTRVKRAYLSLLKRSTSITFFVTSEEEKRAAELIFNDARIDLFPNFRLDLIGSKNLYVEDLKTRAYNFGIIGRISPIKNQLSVMHLFRDNTSTLLVRGPAEDDQYAQLCRAAITPKVIFEDIAETNVNNFFSAD